MEPLGVQDLDTLGDMVLEPKGRPEMPGIGPTYRPTTSIIGPGDLGRQVVQRGSR